MDLINTIKHVASFAEQKADSINAAYGAVHFRKGEVYASNGKVAACAPIELKIECAVSAPKLLKLLRAVRGDPKFVVDTKGRQLVVTAGKAKARLELMDHRSAPRMERPPKDVVWRPTTALGSISKVGWCTDHGQDRIHLTGVQLAEHGMAATNGSALCKLGGTDLAQLLGVAEALVPPKALHDLPDECWVAATAVNDQATRLFVADDAEGRSFRVCSLLAALFPPVDQIVGSVAHGASAKVMREPFIDIVKRAKLGSDMFALEASGDRLSVATDDNRQSALFSFSDSVPLEDKEAKFFEGKIGIDPRYLLPALEGCESDKVKIRMSGDLDPVVIEDGEFLAIIMPFRM
jgi:hypothetical protein